MPYFFFCFFIFAASARYASAELRQVVVVARHGVRGPFGPVGTTVSEEHLQPYSTNGYKFLVKGTDWGTSDDPKAYVAPQITKHGTLVIKKMGEYFRKFEYGKLFNDRERLTNEDCDRLMAYADSNERDNVTAIAFLRGFAPECDKLMPSNNGAEALFQQGQSATATCPICTREEFAGIIGSNTTEYLVHVYAKQIAALNDILKCCHPSLCGPELNATQQCTFLSIPCTWRLTFFTEWFLLQALNNMSLPTNKMTLRDVIDLSSVHLAHMELMTNEYAVANFGSTLLSHITAALEQTVSGKRIQLSDGAGPQILHDVHNRFLYYTGHDINLLFLRKFLRMEWLTKGWLPNQPAVGGMIIFELHYESDNSYWNPKSNYFIKVFFEGASPSQIRNADTLTATNPPERVPIAIPLCSETHGDSLRCPFSTFKTIVAKVIKSHCASQNMQKFIQSLNASPTEAGKASGVIIGFIVAILFALCIGMFLPKCLIALQHRARQLRNKEAEGEDSKEYLLIKP